MIKNFFDVAKISGNDIDDKKNGKNRKDETRGNFNLRHTSKLYHVIMGR